MTLTFPTGHFLSHFISHEQHFSAQMAGCLKGMPLAEVVPGCTLRGQGSSHPPPPTPMSSSAYFPEEVGTEDMSLGHSTQTLQEGTQPTWQRLSGPHLCVMELSGS